MKNIPIVLSFMPNYFIPAATCILSILKHSKVSDSFHVICLLGEPLPDKMKRKLEELNKNRLRFSFINLQGKLDDKYVSNKYTAAASYRLLLPDLLLEYQKVIYIDCDVVVRNDLAELYRKVELADNYVAGVFEAVLDFQIPYIKAIGCVPGSYANTGLLVMNLESLRKDNIVARFLETSTRKELEFLDQDVINIVCKGRILGLPPYYNSIRTYYLPQYKANFLKYYSKADWQMVQSHGTVHYTGTKPWNAFTIEFATWWKYYKMLPSDVRQNALPSGRMKIIYAIYSTSFGRFFIDEGQSLYRKLKYG